MCYARSGYSNYSAWLAGMLGSQLLADRMIDAGQGVVFGGYFAANRSSLARYPRAFYAALTSMQLYANAEIDHFMERTWGLLLTASDAVELAADMQRPVNRQYSDRCNLPDTPKDATPAAGLYRLNSALSILCALGVVIWKCRRSSPT